MDAYNQLVRAARNYTAQTMGDRGLGTGGRLEVEGSREAQQAANAGMTLREAQQRLKDLGYYTGTVDGITGPRTQDAIRRFQADHGLSQTGTLTPPTIRALRGDN
jgi:peptidoglycan hydrolase-like protein with peptidoglycan-binding domain